MKCENIFLRSSFVTYKWLQVALLFVFITVVHSTSPTVSPSSVRSSLNNIYTVAGTGSGVNGGTGGVATAMSLAHSIHVSEDTNGQVYVVENGAHCIRKFLYPNGIVYASVGMCTLNGFAGDNGPSTSALMYGVRCLSISTTGIMYTSDGNNNRVRVVSSSGIISTLAGSNTASDTGDGGLASSATVNFPTGIWVDSTGQVYVGSYHIRKINSFSIISLVAGTGESTISGDGGPATSASFYSEQLTLDTSGILYIGDTGNSRVRKVVLSGIITTIIGSSSTSYSGENVAGTSCNLNLAAGVAIDSSNGDIYVNSYGNNRVHVMTKSSGLMTTFAGSGNSGYGGDGAAATSAKMTSIQGLFLDSSGLLFISDYGNYRIRLIYSVTPTLQPTLYPTTSAPTRSTVNSIYTIVGTGASSSSGTGSTANLVSTKQPQAVWQDTTGVVYVAESFGYCIRKFSYPTGIVINVAGVCSVSGSFGDKCPATSALLDYPLAVIVTTSGEVYFTDFNNNRVRKVQSTTISTIMGSIGITSDGGDGGAASSATIGQPVGLWLDSTGIIYVSGNSNGIVKRISTSLIVTTFAGTVSGSYSGDGGPATSARLYYPERVFTESTGVVYIAGYGFHKVLKVSASGIISTSMGTGSTAYNGENLPGTSTNIFSPEGIVVDTSNGDIYVAAYDQHRIHVMTKTSGLVTTFAGTGTASYGGDGGAATSGSINQPNGIFLNTVNILFISERANNRVRVVYYVSPTVQPSIAPSANPTRSSLNNIYTIAGTGTQSSTGTGGVATAMTVNYAIDVFQDTIGQIYVVEHFGQCIRKFMYPNGIVYPSIGVCNSPGFSGDSGQATAALVSSVLAVGMTTTGIIYAADTGNNRVRKVASNGIITTLTGNGSPNDSGYGGLASAATVNNPRGLWVDSIGQVYIGRYVIRKIDTASIVILIAGTGADGFSGDGGQATASLMDSLELIVDSTGLLYISDSNNHRIRQVSSTGIINTAFGTGSCSYSGENVVASASNVCLPSGIVIDSVNGDILVSSAGDYRIQLITKSTGLLSTYAGCGSWTSFSGDGGAATAAQITPQGLHLNTAGLLFLVDHQAFRIRVVYSVAPTNQPTVVPTVKPTQPTSQPTNHPSSHPSDQPTNRPTNQPSRQPTSFPTKQPTNQPSLQPRSQPSNQPSSKPTNQPSCQPFVQPSDQPTFQPSLRPSTHPSLQPTVQPSSNPTLQPTGQPSRQPYRQPTRQPSNQPICQPTSQPSSHPSLQPSLQPSTQPTSQPFCKPSKQPSSQPTSQPSSHPSHYPSSYPSSQPTRQPLSRPSTQPSVQPTRNPSSQPTVLPKADPTSQPTLQPLSTPSAEPSSIPSCKPSALPSTQPTESPTMQPTNFPSTVPSTSPTSKPTRQPSSQPSSQPSAQPIDQPSIKPTTQPSNQPTKQPYVKPTSQPSCQPSRQPSSQPTVSPSLNPSGRPSNYPTKQPQARPSAQPTERPSSQPSVQPSHQPAGRPSRQPYSHPTSQPSMQPIVDPSSAPSRQPSGQPSRSPTQQPSSFPSRQPTVQPSAPTMKPTEGTPTVVPTVPYIDGSTLPYNYSISVIDNFNANISFKIVIPSQPSIFNQINVPIAFSDIVLNGGVLGTGNVVYGNSSMKSYATKSFSKFVSADNVRRSVSVLPDLNGDGFDDLIIGDPINARCYVLYGTFRGLLNMTQGFTIFGESEGDLTGWSASGAGDVNNDTMQDIIVGAPNAKGVGVAYFIFGRKTMRDVYLKNLAPSEGFTFSGTIRNDYLGISVSNAGDVNKDKFDDVIVGAISTLSYYAGAAYVLYGGNNLQSLTTNQVDAKKGFKASGIAYMYAGISVSGAGDVNCDGYADVIIGSSPVRAGLSLSAFIVYGNTTIANIALNMLIPSKGVQIVGSGMVVAKAVGLDNDKCTDVIAGSDIVNDGTALIVYTNVNNLIYSSSSPTFVPSTKPLTLPSLSPILKPTRSPSMKPTWKPSILPTIVPTSPTTEPMVGSTESPTEFVTMQPSVQPSEIPTENPTIEQSAEPSDAPTQEPTIVPILLPTVLPSFEPSSIPITIEPTAGPSEGKSRSPFGIPTRRPTITVTLPPLIEFVVNGKTAMYNDSASIVATHYSVNATGMIKIDPARAKCIYLIVPGTNLTFTIVRFNASCDVIDLHLFNSIRGFSDLTIIAGSVIVNLPTGQVIHILDQEPTAMSESNFIFASTEEKHYNLTAFVISVVIICIPVLVISLIVVYCIYRYSSTKKKVTSSYSQKFIGQFETNLAGEYILIDEDEDISTIISYDSYVEENDVEPLSVNLSDFTMGSLSNSQVSDKINENNNEQYSSRDEALADELNVNNQYFPYGYDEESLMQREYIINNNYNFNALNSFGSFSDYNDNYMNNDDPLNDNMFSYQNVDDSNYYFDDQQFENEEIDQSFNSYYNQNEMTNDDVIDWENEAINYDHQSNYNNSNDWLL